MDIRIRQIKESDYEAIISVLDEWWGGRQMAAMLLRLFFKHFSETGSPEGGFRGYGFHAGIDHPGADGDILGPKRHQPPVAFLDVSLAFMDHNDGYFLGGGDVVVGLDLERGWVSIEEPLKLT